MVTRFVRSVSDIFDLFFVAGNGNWMNQIKGQLKDIDFSQYDQAFDYPTVYARMNATEGIIFPIIDWAYNYRKLSNFWHIKSISGVSSDTFSDFYPCFYAKTILKSIIENYGYVLSGNLLDDPIYDTLIITPDQLRSDNYVAPSPNNEFMISANYIIGVRQTITMTSGSNLFDSALNSIVLPADVSSGTATITFTLSTSIDHTFHIEIIRDIAGIGSTIATEAFFVTSTPTEFSAVIPLGSFDAGDKIRLVGDPIVTGRFFTIHAGRVDFNLNFNYIYVSDLVPDMDQFEFIKYIAQRFTCLLDFNDDTQTLSFTKLDSIVKADAVDLTAMLSKYQQIPSSGYQARNYLRTKGAAELFNYKNDALNFGD